MQVLIFTSVILLAWCCQAATQADQERCPLQGTATTTPPDAEGPFYVENSPVTADMGPANLLQDPTQRLSIKGRVLSAHNNNKNCSFGIPNVKMEVWYAGPPDAVTGEFYQDDNYRGQITTDNCGFYAYNQVFPALYPGRPILRNHIRLEHQDGTELLITQMYFVGQGTGYVSPGERILQSVEVSVDANSTNGSRSAEFDMFVDVGNGVRCDKDGQVVEEQPEEEDQPTEAPTTPQEPTSKSPTTTPQDPPEEDPRCVFFCLDLK